MSLALYVAFWMQLDGASSAAVTVGILALPTRGQAIQKAFYRLIATVISVSWHRSSSRGFSTRSRTLFLVALAGWLAICVFAAGWLDGNRAYAAVLSGFTVAIVAVPNIDSPQDTFSSGINRGAAVIIGILAVAVVSDLFRAPDLLPGLRSRLDALHRDVKRFALRTLNSGASDPIAVARLYGRIAVLRADVVTLADGVGRGAGGGPVAARRALSALVGEARATRILASTFEETGDRHLWRTQIAKAFEGDGAGAEHLLDHRAGAGDEATASFARLTGARAAEALVSSDGAVIDSLRDMESGQGPGRGPGLPVYRSWQAAARNALRVFVAVLVSATVLVLSGWPSTTFALAQIAALASIAAINPTHGVSRSAPSSPCRSWWRWQGLRNSSCSMASTTFCCSASPCWCRSSSAAC